jgi:hypothetical protein
VKEQFDSLTAIRCVTVTAWLFSSQGSDMLAASWIASFVRFIHSLEILADSLVYAGALVWLLSGQRAEQHDRSTRLSSFSPITGHRR